MNKDMSSTLEEVGEDFLLRRFAARLEPKGRLVVGPGDDCAVVRPEMGGAILLKTDAVIEGVHFTPGTEPALVGHKAMARVASDFAAMGGRPEHFLVTMLLRADTPLDWLDSFYQGAGEAIEAWDATIAGGETGRMPASGPQVISIAATGCLPSGDPILRSGGQPGDILLVTGRLGGSFASGRHLTFTPRLREAAWLAAHCRPSAMMDLSDGLARDLPRLAEASRCSFLIDPASIPLHEGCDATHAAGDGEDYELLAAISADKIPDLRSQWTAEFPDTPLTPIGRLTPSGTPATPLNGGWDHFSHA